MNLNAIFKELGDLAASDDSTTLARTLNDVSTLAAMVRAAEVALRALANTANQPTDVQIKDLLTAELGLRNHAAFTKTSTEKNSLLNAVIQKRRSIEFQVHAETQKKSQRKANLGNFSKQEKSRKTRIGQDSTISEDETFNPAQFEEISDADAAMSWQMKARLRDEKRKRREQRAEVLKEMHDRLRTKPDARNTTMEDEEAATPVALFEQIKRQLRFVPKKSHAWACTLLSVPTDASLDFAKSKYRERARLWHPDMSDASEKAVMTEAMAWLNEAWKIFRQAH